MKVKKMAERMSGSVKAERERAPVTQTERLTAKAEDGSGTQDRERYRETELQPTRKTVKSGNGL